MKLAYTDEQPDIKWCNRCGEHKPLDQFRPKTVNRWGVTRYSGFCKPCMRNARLKSAREHPESEHARNARWQKANPDKVRELIQRRRVKVGPISHVDLRDWYRLVRRFDGRCAYCGDRVKLTQDHVTPISRGGRHTIGNLLPACSPCNNRKGTKFLVELGWRVVSEISCNSTQPGIDSPYVQDRRVG